jgi:hypothetical protein
VLVLSSAGAACQLRPGVRGHPANSSDKDVDRVIEVAAYRHRWRSEGFDGKAKTWHGLARAVKRGLAKMNI